MSNVRFGYDGPLEFGFYIGGSVSFTGRTADTKSLGGSEFAAVQLAEALVRAGHLVSVFTPFSAEAYPETLEVFHKGVRYYASPQMVSPIMHMKNWDVFVVSRDYEKLTSSLIQAKQIVLWNHDVLSDPARFLECIYPVSRIYCMSEWQIDQYLSKIKAHADGKDVLSRKHFTLTSNGVDVRSLPEITPIPRVVEELNLSSIVAAPTFLYASRPERGLMILLRDIWPVILRRMPNARLFVTHYNVSQESLPEEIRQVHRYCDELMKQHASSVIYIDEGLSHSKLYNLMSSVTAMLYPGIFPEISCMAALEMQAMGRPVFSTGFAALGEHNFIQEFQVFDKDLLLDANPAIRLAHIEEAVKRIYTALYDADAFSTCQYLCSTTALMVRTTRSWDAIARGWVIDATGLFTLRAMAQADAVVANMVYMSDLLAASHTLDWLPDSGIRTLTTDQAEDLDKLRVQVHDLLAHQHDEPEQYGQRVDADDAEDITQLPDRMRIALEAMEQHFGLEKRFTLLDVGCGTGRFLYHALKRFPHVSVMGVDFSNRCLARADHNLRTLLPQLARMYDDQQEESSILPFLVQGDFINTPPPGVFETSIEDGSSLTYDERPDCIFVGEWLEHQQELEKALTHVNTWCKPGGLVIYTVPSGPWEAITFGDAHTADGHEIRFHVSHFEERDIQEMFARIQDIGYQHVHIQGSPIDHMPIGHFVISYIAEEKGAFTTPDYKRKFWTMRPRPRIGACLIAKNEEDNILRALKPLHRRFDVIVVGDTGSTDMTRELAGRYALVIDATKAYEDGGFAGARNFTRDHMCRQRRLDWIYWQDCDEVLNFPHRVHHYLSGDLEIFEGFIVTQNHLMLDLPLTRDLPTRLFPNKPGYRWHGLIHEHVMDLGWDPEGNKNLFPTLILPDVKVAHYGYSTEGDRRRKAIERNIPMLKRDREVNPKRQLGAICLMRDYMHYVKWYIELGVAITDEHVEALHSTVDMYQTLFADREHQYHGLGFIFYQEALQIMSACRVAMPDGRVPINIVWFLGGAVGGPLHESHPRTPLSKWFLSTEEAAAYLEADVRKLTSKLVVSHDLFPV